MPQTIVTVATRGQGLYEFTREAAAFVHGSGVDAGLLTVFVRHTSCSLLIQENADPSVQADLQAFRRQDSSRLGSQGTRDPSSPCSTRRVERARQRSLPIWQVSWHCRGKP